MFSATGRMYCTSRYSTVNAAVHRPMPIATAVSTSIHNGRSSSVGEGTIRYRASRTPITPAAIAKSTRLDPTLAPGRIRRGKYTLEINPELPIRQPLTFVSTMLKKFQPSSPANMNTMGGTPPVGNRPP